MTSRITDFDGSFIRYLLGIPTGSFLQYILENDLMGAMGHADHINKYRLHDICSVVYNELPLLCHGSKDEVNKWLEMNDTERLDVCKRAKHLSLCKQALNLHNDIQKRKEETNDRSKRKRN